MIGHRYSAAPDAWKRNDYFPSIESPSIDHQYPYWTGKFLGMPKGLFPVPSALLLREEGVQG